MRDLSSIDFKDNVRFVIRRELKSLGLKVPKYKLHNKQSIECNREGVFGVYLDKVPSSNVSEEFYCGVPKFLVDACNFLRHHLATEGLFRKSGSVQRQKLLKQRVEIGEKISATAHPHDVASLIKQFFRHLQEPLLTNLYHDSFIKALKQEGEGDRVIIILYTCLMLPLVHLQTLQYFMKFAAEVASQSSRSGMSISNLAIVLTPNLMHNSKKDNNGSASEKLLKDQTMVIETLLKHAERIGLIPEDIYERAKMIGDDGGDMTSSGDELDGEYQSRKSKRVPRARTRTGSLTGFFGQSLNKLKTNSNSSNHHRRSKSVKPQSYKNRIHDTQPAAISKDDSHLTKANALTTEGIELRSISNKRRIMEYNNAAMSPAFKRRARVSKNEGDSGIGHPVIISKSTQMFTTTIKPLTPVRPLTDMVKKEHAKTLLSVENEHVKVIDATTYIPSPDNGTQEDNGQRTSVSDDVFESPVTAGGKMSNKGDIHKRRVTRRNSSGATTCFSSSPRHRRRGSKQNLIEDESKKGNQTLNRENIRPEVIANTGATDYCNTPNKYDHDNMYPKEKHPGSAMKITVEETMTPCKLHVATPPMPHTTNKELKTLLSTKI